MRKLQLASLITGIILNLLFVAIAVNRVVFVHAADVNFDPLEGPTQETFDQLDPLQIGHSAQAEKLSLPGGVVSRMLVFALPIAGMILFVMLVWGGFEILAGSATSKSVESGKQRIKAAIVGFILLFSSYWMAQILQEVFGIKIL